MNIEQVKAFIFVALSGSFSKAAEVLYLSQPTVSARIKNLELQLNCELFKRVGNQVMLTKEGEAFLPHAQEMLQQLRDGQLAIQRVQDKLEGELSISSVFIAANYILPDLIQEFHELYPKVKLTLYTGHSHHVLEMVLNHQVPFGIARAISHPQIENIRIMDDQMVLCIYPDHPFHTRQVVSMEEVAAERLILFNRGSSDWTLIQSAFEHLQVQQQVTMETDNIKVATRMVERKLGIAILPRFAIQEDLDNHRLKIVEVKNLPQINRNFELIYLKGASFDGIMKVFIDFLVSKNNAYYKT